MTKKEKFNSLETIWLQAGEESRSFKASLIGVGFLRAWGGRQSNRYIPGGVLEQAVNDGKFDDLAVFVDHAGFFEYPKVERLVAVTRDATWDGETGNVIATVEFYRRELADAIVNIFDQMLINENKPDIGFSLVFWGSYADREDPDDPLVLATIDHIESADIVFEPASGAARVLEALSAQYQPIYQTVTSDRINRNEVNVMPEEINNTEEREEFDQETFRNDILEEVGSRMDSYINRLDERISTRLARIEEEEAIQLGGQPPRSPEIVMGLNGFEELEAAARALLSGSNPPAGVRHLSGIRELYLLLSGDYEMTGRYHADRIQFAAVDSSTLAYIFADALNKRVIEVGDLFPRWWAPAVTIENFNTLQDAKWIVLGGVGELPTVAEGSAYTELTLDDQQESDAFVKKGGYLGVTLEAIDKDDTRKVQAIPRVLARAAWVTLGKAIATIFSQASGVGPTMSDSVVMFHADHSNLGSTALSFTSWASARGLMQKQTELNSAERLGALNAPHLLWVPVDLEYTAIQIIASMHDPSEGTTTSFEAINPEAMDDSQRARLEAARERVIVCPYWTDANDWMAQANPLLYPGLGLGYRFGENPEIFSVADPRAGLMFSNDVMPVKVRYFYAVGPIDYRPFYKHNVA